MTGLPDEAVEAMCRGVYRSWPQCPNPAGVRSVVVDVLAALPAGVYVSDGKGTVSRNDSLSDAIREVSDAAG